MLLAPDQSLRRLIKHKDDKHQKDRHQRLPEMRRNITTVTPARWTTLDLPSARWTSIDLGGHDSDSDSREELRDLFSSPAFMVPFMAG